METVGYVVRDKPRINNLVVNRPQEEKHLIAEALEAFGDASIPKNPRWAEVFFAMAEQERREH